MFMKKRIVTLAAALTVLVSCTMFGRPALASEEPHSVAVNKPAFASSAEEGFTAANAFDSDAATRWSSSYSDPQWIFIDLVGNYLVSEVKLNWEAAYAKAYKIQVSRDAVHWTDVYSTATGDGGIDDITFSPTNAQFVRVYGIQRATSWGYSLYNVDVIGAANP
ncbi:discoidin domain-containing protein [Paenibacillus spiritus]|uniref:Discoidin domain-containing protein n=1 Tax=Paenibacillus spiritus TaxID=2496557 RepID=A0A5J5GCJ5_9BACL|nr:discoidin domain-containing protein [Paenibacillus spiritus]KAA9005875.1 discoidin domain-containing protein [Paenibacillus spiritus]